MIKYRVTISFLIWCIAAVAQPNNSGLEKKLVAQEKKIDSISSLLSDTKSSLRQLTDSFQTNLAKTLGKKNSATGFARVFTRVMTSWFLVMALLALSTLGGFLIIRHKLKQTLDSLEKKITNSHYELNDQALKLETKFAEVLQLTLLKSEGPAPKEPDHRLALRVGEEIHRMRKRLENMPAETKGMSALTNSLERLEEEFNNSGYEMDNLLGMKYIDGMKVEARFVDNPDIPKGEEIITDILRPAIKYKGVLIQVAKVEVGKS